MLICVKEVTYLRIVVGEGLSFGSHIVTIKEIMMVALVVLKRVLRQIWTFKECHTVLVSSSIQILLCVLQLNLEVIRRGILFIFKQMV